MVKFSIITLFPEIFEDYLKYSILGRAQKEKIIKIKAVNLYDFVEKENGRTKKRVDDKPFGGGRGMVIRLEPVLKAVESLKTKTKLKGKAKVILFSPRGEKFSQKLARKFSKMDHLILIAGRYEGIDERIAEHVSDYNLSIGDYVLMGGDLPILVFIESVARLIPGVIQKPELLEERITKKGGFVEYPQYTRPEVFDPGKGKRKWKVPKVLLSGDHRKIQEWRNKNSQVIE